MAHEIRPAIFTLKIQQDRTVKLISSLNVEALLAQIGAEHSDSDDSPNAAKYNSLRRTSPQQLEKELLTFKDEWISNIGLSFDGAPANLEIDNLALSEVGDVELARISEITMTGKIPPEAKTLGWAYAVQYGSSVLRIERPGQEVEANWYEAGQSTKEIAIFAAEEKSRLQVFLDYIVIGFTHIIPKGLDHILFVLGLFLLNQNWKPLLAQVTAFTIAHSVTLALSLYGYISVSPAIVEPLIALSIVYVAVENIFTTKLHIWRPIVVFLFGLLHGMGFAGVLTEVGLAPKDFTLGLIAFNVGVEFGQLAVIAIGFLALIWFMKKPWYHSRIVVPLSAAIAAMGAWWFVERTFF